MNFKSVETLYSSTLGVFLEYGYKKNIKYSDIYSFQNFFFVDFVKVIMRFIFYFLKLIFIKHLVE
jgi:hypothetical protein